MATVRVRVGRRTLLFELDQLFSRWRLGEGDPEARRLAARELIRRIEALGYTVKLMDGAVLEALLVRGKPVWVNAWSSDPHPYEKLEPTLPPDVRDLLRRLAREGLALH